MVGWNGGVNSIEVKELQELFSNSRKEQEMKKMRCWNGFVL